MSARRRQGRDSAFADNNGAFTLEETDAAIFGSIEAVDSGRQVAKPVSIFEIYPDLVQPRRAVPSIVRDKWNGRPDTVAEMLAFWHEIVVHERGSAGFDIYPYLFPQEEVERPKSVRPVEALFLDLVELAASIRQHGLTNPITVARIADGYRLETGERRWLAYHLLHAYEPDSKQWERIPARVVETPDVWRQASENGARENLNAISKARQLALLVMEIHRRKGVSFKSFDQMVKAGESDRAFYAQVADGARYPVTGHGEAVLNALGFKQPSQMREHRELLRLPDEVWQLADDLNWPYGRIESLRRESLGDEKQFVQIAIKKAYNQGYVLYIPNEDSPALLQKKSDDTLHPLVFPQYRQIFNGLWALARKVGEGDVHANQNDLENVKTMKRWLDELEKAIYDNLPK